MRGYSNLQNFLYGGSDGFPVSEEPTYLTFCIDFNFNSTYLDAWGTYTSPLLNLQSSDVSARTFLEARGFNEEAYRLGKFIEVLRDVSLNKPWYFQEIRGVDKMWGNATNMEDGYKGKELSLEIITMEAIDLKIAYLADLYRKSVYDTIYMRELLPENLRQFNMQIYVGEFRHLEMFGAKPTYTPRQLMEVNSTYFAQHATFYAFDCYMCEFDFDTSVPAAEFTVSKFDQPASNKFKINVGWFMEKHSFGFYDISTIQSMAPNLKPDEALRKEYVDGVTGLAMTVNRNTAGPPPYGEQVDVKPGW